MDSLLKRPYFVGFWVLVTLKAILAVYFIYLGVLHLVPDEAQYWLWSQNLDWGYYSKPPGIAWLIAFGTHLLGNNELGVRFGSVLVSFGMATSSFYLAKTCKLEDKVCFWAGAVMAISPLGLISSIYATTDWALILFWSLACLFLLKAFVKETSPNYYLIGLMILLGALFKWTIFIFWIPVLAVAAFKRIWWKMPLLYGILISLLGFVPSLIWNVRHDWGTFRHVWIQMSGGNVVQTMPIGWNGNPIDFIGAQVAILSPIYFGLLCFAFWVLLKREEKIPVQVRIGGFICFAILLGYFILSFYQKIQGNWAIYAYGSGIMALCWVSFNRLKSGSFWMISGAVVSFIFFFMILSIPLIQAHNIFPAVQIPYSINPFRANIGWQRLPKILQDAGYRPKDDFLISDKYQTSSLLSFYSESQKGAYFLNLSNCRRNQFSFWPGLETESPGKTGYFVIIEDLKNPKVQTQLTRNYYEQTLRAYFAEVRYVGSYPLFESYGRVVKWAMIYKCVGYNGYTLCPTLYW